MATRKILSRILDVGIVGVYTPIVLITTPLLVMNPVGVVTVIPSFLTFTLIGKKSDLAMGLKVGAISIPFLLYAYEEGQDRNDINEREK
jgi:hypothetical protein